MQIATKLPVTLATVGVLLFGGYGWYLLATEERDLRRVAEHEMRLHGHTLQLALGQALRDGRGDDIADNLAALERLEPGLRARVYDRERALLHGNPERQLSSTTLARLFDDFDNTTQRLPIVHFSPREAPAQLDLIAPLTTINAGDAGEPIAAFLVLSRPLGEMQRDLAVTRRGIVVSMIAFVILALLVGRFVGHVYITRPLASVVDAMRRIRRGELDASSAGARRHDEIGRMAHEFDDMVGALREARAELERAAETRRQHQRELQQVDKLITLGQLSAGLAHEIGSPLQVLQGRAQLLQQKADNADDVRRQATIITEETARIARIVEQLMRLTRRPQARTAPVDLAATVRNVLDFVDIEARRRDLRLSFDCDRELPLIDGDADQLQQVILNLVTNAFAATPAGGAIRIALTTADDALCLRISDDGDGIPDEVRERIFEPFFTTRGDEGGTGLGLAVTESIVREHGGSIRIAENDGRGATFEVRLPLPGNADEARA